MRDTVHAWPPREENLFLRFQPVFTAQGRVHEYAVADSFTAWRGADNLAPQRARLRAAAAFAEQSGALIDLSFEHALTGPGDADLAQRLCTDLDMGLSRDQLCLGALAGRERARLATRRLTFLLPLFRRLLPQACVLASYTEFQPGLRAQLLPATCGGEPVACGALRACGLTLKIPRGLGADRTLQQRFRALMACIEGAKLHVVADDIEDIHDFVWLRAHPGLLFRGAMLSAPLSAQCLAVWLRADGGAWRSFNACVDRPGPGAG